MPLPHIIDLPFAYTNFQAFRNCRQKISQTKNSNSFCIYFFTVHLQRLLIPYSPSFPRNLDFGIDCLWNFFLPMKIATFELLNPTNLQDKIWRKYDIMDGQCNHRSHFFFNKENVNNIKNICGPVAIFFQKINLSA